MIKNMKTKKIIWLLMGAALVAGCAKDAKTSDNEDNKAYIEAWLAKNHPGVNPSGIGIYVLDNQPGTGKTLSDQGYIYVSYTTRDMDGNIGVSTEADIAKQLGTYDKTYYYGPQVMAIGNEVLNVGVEEMLKGMQVGGTRTALIPAWLMGYKRYKDADTYYRKASGDDYSNTIFTFTLEDIIDDETIWETDSLARYLGKHHSGMTKLEEGIYYQKLSGSSTAKMPNDTTVYINYSGRLLNGQIFDTNVANTAKVAGIYVSGHTYEPTEVHWGEKYSDMNMGSQNSPMIEGFARILYEMHPGEKGIGAFISSKGYGESGSGNRIPPCAPLIFEIELVPQP